MHCFITESYCCEVLITIIEMSPQGTNYKSNFKLRANGKTLKLAKPVVMGIINLTPDSFYDGGTINSPVQLLKKAEKQVDEGAAILDLGAVSTRPGASTVSLEEELRRLLPALKLIRNTFPKIFISVDTFRAPVALAAAELGADIINDISGGTHDLTMFKTVAKAKLPYVLMHMQGTPQTMQQNPRYKNVTKEVHGFFQRQIKKARTAGMKQIICDPGFGFGKTVKHNYTLLKNLAEFSKFNCPVLAGISRKSMVNKVLEVKSQDALTGTIVLNSVALLNGANILRVHDVKEAIEAIKLVNNLL